MESSEHPFWAVCEVLKLLWLFFKLVFRSIKGQKNTEAPFFIIFHAKLAILNQNQKGYICINMGQQVL